MRRVIGAFFLFCFLASYGHSQVRPGVNALLILTAEQHEETLTNMSTNSDLGAIRLLYDLIPHLPDSELPMADRILTRFANQVKKMTDYKTLLNDRENLEKNYAARNKYFDDLDRISGFSLGLKIDSLFSRAKLIKTIKNKDLSYYRMTLERVSPDVQLATLSPLARSMRGNVIGTAEAMTHFAIRNAKDACHKLLMSPDFKAKRVLLFISTYSGGVPQDEDILVLAESNFSSVRDMVAEVAHHYQKISSAILERLKNDPDESVRETALKSIENMRSSQEFAQ